MNCLKPTLTGCLLLLAMGGWFLYPQTTSKSFLEPFDGPTVDTARWQVATWVEHNGQTGTARCFVSDGCLNLVLRNEDGRILSAALQTWGRFLFGKWEARLKCASQAGVLNSFYTIDWDNDQTPEPADGSKQEVDLELLTRSFGPGSGQAHLAVHEAGQTSWDTAPDLDLGFNPSAAFHTWSVEITSTFIRWSVDGRVLHTYRYAEHPIAITRPYQLKLNTWTGGSWVGGPPPSGVDCVYQVDWIRFTEYPAGEPPLELTAPAGGEVWRLGQERAITWQSSGVESPLVLELLSGETLLGEIAHGVPVASGSWLWQVGTLADGRRVSGPDLKIRIRTPDGKTADQRKL